MLTSITVRPHSFTENVLFFKTADLTPFPNRVVPLFGPNGVGKSTLIQAIEKHQLDVTITGPKNSIFSYQNARDNCKVRQPRSYAESFDPAFLTSRLDAQSVSEGQSIIYSMFDLLDGLNPKTGGLQPDGTDFVILLDEIDSGMSIDNIDLTMRKIKNLVKKRDDLQFIFSFNSPRILKHFPIVLSMYTGLPIELHTDEDMLTEIRNHKKMFDHARKNSRGRPKIYN